MKLESLANAVPDAHLIRLYRFTPGDALNLKELVRLLAAGERQSVALQNEPWIEPVGGCCLLLQRGNRDQGIRQMEPLSFACQLSPIGWENVEGLLEPFCASVAGGFQWLVQSRSGALLISHTGKW
jgi:hypothetical protein